MRFSGRRSSKYKGPEVGRMSMSEEAHNTRGELGANQGRLGKP